MSRREASINDVRIDEAERQIFGPRPGDRRSDAPSLDVRTIGGLGNGRGR
jgi:nuclear transport factor 2 (NTF2) superfamily protein